MKKFKKVIALFLVAVMTMMLFTACGGSSGNSGETGSNDSNDGGETGGSGSAESTGGTTDTSEHVELTMYLLGERTPDFDEVYGKINEILEEKLNCSLKVEFLSWGEHDTKYSLLFSGHEDFDLIFTASTWAHYEQTVALGGFEPMTEDFVKTYAPDIWEIVPEMAWEQAKINGVPYMIPNYMNEFGQEVMAIRSDIMEKANIEQVTNWDELVKFYMACADQGIYASQGGPWYQFFQNHGMNNLNGAPKSGEMVLFNTMDANDTNVYYILDWEPFTEYCKQVKEMADAGCWSPDVLNANDERQTGLLTGKTASMVWNMKTCLTYGRQANEENPDWNVILTDPVSGFPKRVNPYNNNGMAINKNSKNKERAMMVLNEFMTNPAVYDLAMLGIEGKHWEAVGDDQYKIIDESGFGVNNNCNWGWNNMNIGRKEYVENPTTIDELYDKMDAEWNANIKSDHVLDGFTFDPTNVATQYAAVEANIDTYYNPLINGLVDDVDSSLDQFRNALEAAGIRDVLEEIERQVQEYVATK